jgi:L-ascorbate metabolism protein UlaG (beta-lactamase superfamily)
VELNVALIALPMRQPSAFIKIKRQPAVDHALVFIDSIESTWKGHEQFAIWLVHRLRPKTIVDLGFDRGLSTIAFAYRNRGHVFGIDWFEDGNYAAKSFALDSAFRNISNAIRFNYVKNIHLTIGPFSHVSKNWKRKIDLLHIDWAHSYRSARQHYLNWSQFLKPDAVILMHDVVAFPDGAGKAFQELPMPKLILPHACGLGVACADLALLEEIRTIHQVIPNSKHNVD